MKVQQENGHIRDTFELNKRTGGIRQLELSLEESKIKKRQNKLGLQTRSYKGFRKPYQEMDRTSKIEAGIRRRLAEGTFNKVQPSEKNLSCIQNSVPE